MVKLAPSFVSAMSLVLLGMGAASAAQWPAQFEYNAPFGAQVSLSGSEPGGANEFSTGGGGDGTPSVFRSGFLGPPCVGCAPSAAASASASQHSVGTSARRGATEQYFVGSRASIYDTFTIVGTSGTQPAFTLNWTLEGSGTWTETPLNFPTIGWSMTFVGYGLLFTDFISFDISADGGEFSVNDSGAIVIDADFLSERADAAINLAVGDSFIVGTTLFVSASTGASADFLSTGTFSITSNVEGVSLVSAALVPEPATYAMTLAGLALLGFVARRRT